MKSCIDALDSRSSIWTPRMVPEWSEFWQDKRHLKHEVSSSTFAAHLSGDQRFRIVLGCILSTFIGNPDLNCSSSTQVKKCHFTPLGTRSTTPQIVTNGGWSLPFTLSGKVIICSLSLCKRLIIVQASAMCRLLRPSFLPCTYLLRLPAKRTSEDLSLLIWQAILRTKV